jgi:hypothetical protein
MARTNKQHPSAAAQAAAFDAQLKAEQDAQATAGQNPAVGGVSGDATGATVAPVLAAPAAIAPVVVPAAALFAEPAATGESLEDRIQAARDEARREAIAEARTQATAEFDLERQGFQDQLARLSGETALERTAREAAETRLREIDHQKLYEVDLSGVEFLAPEAAREVTDKVLRPVIDRIQANFDSQIKAVQKQVSDRDTEHKKGIDTLSEDRKARDRARVNAKVLQAHPDVATIVQAPWFESWKNERVAGTRTTNGTELQTAYAEGDTDFVIQTLDRAKAARQATPTLASVASMPVTQVASFPARETATHNYAQLKQWADEKRMGTLSAKQYAENMASFREAEAAGQVA